MKIRAYAVLLVLGWMLGWATASIYGSAPTIERTGERFRVTFDKGAVGACTIYKQGMLREPDPNWPDGYYTPRHCWGIDDDTTFYNDDWAWIQPEQTSWEVWAEIQYPVKGGKPDEIVIVKTNMIQVLR